MTNIGFDKKLYLGSFGIILLTIVMIALVNFYQTKQSFLTKGETSIQNVSDVLLKTIELKYNLQNEKLEADMAALIGESTSGGKSIMLLPDQTVDIKIHAANSGNNETAAVPKLIFGLEFVTGEFTIPDKVGGNSSSDIAFYQFYDNKLIKVSSNQKNEDESRMIGEYFDAGSDVYKALLEGKKISILTHNGIDESMQILEPFRDFDEDKVVGAYSVSNKVLTADLVNLIKKVTVGGAGYSFINDTKGQILVHPDDAFLNMKASEFKNAQNLLSGSSGQATYEHQGKKYHAYVNYFKAWDLYFTVAVSEGELMTGVNRQILTSSAISGVLALIVGALIIYFMNRQLIRNMKGMANLASEVANGNFNYTFSYKANDAIKETVDSMNLMVEGLAQMCQNLNDGVKTLSEASGELGQVSEKMSQGSENTVARVNTVASAAEEMSVNMDSVAAAMEQASTNVEIVSTGAQDMTASIQQVSNNSNQTREITNKAVEKALKTSHRVGELGQAAEEINKVTDTINRISSQTNLLALNATIEAARAGEAGKGFAVVANEIKELANQTAGATEDIARNIQEIQQQISGAVQEIEEISGIINQIDSFVNESAGAIESQLSTTSQIAENINQVSLGIQEVNVNVSQSSEVSGQVAEEISSVLTASQEINHFSLTVKEKAGILTEVMLQMKALVERFKI